MSYDGEQIAITEFRLQITSMLFLSSAISLTSLMEEVFTSVDRISRLQNRLVSLLILILKSIKLSYSIRRQAVAERSQGDKQSLMLYVSDCFEGIIGISSSHRGAGSTKTKSDGSVERYQTRLAAKGYSQ
ncbi:hypothetical protein OSB04_029425 [Centaurea solstitialis]|uniref:Uncharacterized protein n=1 Tax=Centaurea solstitialis TaxID=347529 RepID=A0AA38SJ83_9ASTR|nr:hypothetical protein OSB04_029425 [Centaurea solstitialis]